MSRAKIIKTLVVSEKNGYTIKKLQFRFVIKNVKKNILIFREITPINLTAFFQFNIFYQLHVKYYSTLCVN